MTIAIDTLTIFDALKKSFTEEQAHTLSRTLAATFDEQAASKRDMKELDVNIRREIKEIELKIEVVRKEVETFRKDVDLKIESLRREIDLKIENVRAELKRDIAEAKADVIRWMIGVGFAQAAFIVAVLKLVP